VSFEENARDKKLAPHWEGLKSLGLEKELQLLMFNRGRILLDNTEVVFATVVDGTNVRCLLMRFRLGNSRP
jgi:hypothetical protein